MEKENALDLRAVRWLPHTPESVWVACSTKDGLEQWWSPEDLRTTVHRLDVRPGGEVLFHVRYVPALFTQGSPEAFRAARIPIDFWIRGTVGQVVDKRLLALELTLDIGRSAAGVETSLRIELTPNGSGTRVELLESGTPTPHLVTLGNKNLEAQLERLAIALDARA